MKTRRILHDAHTHADAATVTDLLDDVDTWSSWSRPLLAHTMWARWGNPAPGGRGAVRQLGLWPVYIRELITSHQRGQYQEYTVLSPNLFTHYLGRINLSGRPDGGALITWTVEFTPRCAVLGPIARFALSRIIERLARRLACAADNLATAASPSCVDSYPAQGIPL